MLAYFNEDITFKLYRLKEDLQTNVLLPDEAERISIFSSYPTHEQVQSGQGALNLVIDKAWTNTSDLFGKQFTIPAIENDEYQQELTYFVGIAILVGSNPVSIVRELKLIHLRTQESKLSVSISDCLMHAPSLPKLFENNMQKLASCIDSAIIEIKSRFATRVINFSMLSNPAALNLAATQLAISNAYFSLTTDPNSIEYSEGVRWESKSNNTYRSVRLDIDKNGNGIAEQTRSAGIGFLRLVR